MGITRDAQACSVESPEGCIFVRRKLGFLEHRTLTVPMTVYAACIGVPCSADTTCNALGQCVSTDVDPSACTSGDGCFLPGESPPASLRAPGTDGGGGADADADADADAGADDADAPGDSGEPIVPTQIALGRARSCVRLSDGAVKCWGLNRGGELGSGDTLDHGEGPGDLDPLRAPVDLGTGRSARALAAGSGHTCALFEDGRVKCWGENGAAQLGLGDTTSRGGAPGQMGDALPFVDFGSGRTVRALAAGLRHTCALLDNDQVKCWGENRGRELGLPTSAPTLGSAPGQMGSALPFVDLGAGRSARALAIGDSHTCVLRDDASLRCWGSYDLGQ